MLFSDLVQYLNKISQTTKRLEITQILKDLFIDHKEEVETIVYLIQGRVAPDYIGVELGVSDKTILKVIRRLTSSKEDEEISLFSKLGDLGMVVEVLMAKGKQTSFFNESLSIDELYNLLWKIAQLKGSGSSITKEGILTDLYIRSSVEEAKYITKIISGSLRLGVSDATIVTSLRLAYRPEMEQNEVEEVYNFHPDAAFLAKLLLSNSLIENVGPTPEIPMKVMLAERLQSISEILTKLKGKAAFEYKYDGLRIQIHKKGEVVRTFSRGNEETTLQFPEIVESIKKLEIDSLIIDGEAVPFNTETGEIYPFQDVSRRRGRKYDLDQKKEEIPIVVFLFDIVYLRGKQLNKIPYIERTEILRSEIKESDRIKFAKQIITSDVTEAEIFFNSSIESGCEGIVAKSIEGNSIYRAGNRGWLWIKFKRDYQNELSDSLDLVVIGAFYGHGRRKGNYGALLLASYNGEGDVFESVCKLGSGFTDENLSELKVMFSDAVSLEKPHNVDSVMVPDVWIYPEKVIQIRGSEITISPVHTCSIGLIGKNGLAVRFPRFMGTWRNDKKAEDCTTSVEIYNMFKLQKKTSYKDDEN
jgi:DNA ligase-1